MSAKNGANLSQRERLEMIDGEVQSFYNYCKDIGLSDEEMDLVCRPLSNVVRKAVVKWWTRAFLAILIVSAIGYNVIQKESIQWHAAAVVRLALIRVLPIWDWTPLYYSKCIINKPQSLPADDTRLLTLEDCNTCEAIRQIQRISSTNYEEVFNHHLIRGAPVIVTDAYHDWAAVGQDVNLTSLISNDPRLGDSVPCRLLTNLRLGRQPMDLQEIFSRIIDTNPNWFIHFQNCDVKAVKMLRILSPRPYFLSPHIPPSHFNWLLISNRYDTHRFKRLELDIGLIVMSQLKGKTKVQLIPKSPCQHECVDLNISVEEGQTLVLSTYLWEFEYCPDKNSDNVAIVTETDWQEE